MGFCRRWLYFGAGAVCAVEANPDLAERCQRHAEVNGFGAIVRVVLCALGGAFGTARLYLGSKDLGSSSIVKPSMDAGFLDVGKFGRRLKVKTRRCLVIFINLGMSE